MTHHEYNRDFKGANTPAAFVNAFQSSQTIWDANQLNKSTGKGEALFVVNAAGSGLGGGSWAIHTHRRPIPCLPTLSILGRCLMTIRNGYPSGHRNYGANTAPGRCRLYQRYLRYGSLSYLGNSDGGTRGWGVGEFNSPRRVARHFCINSTLGWGRHRNMTLAAQDRHDGYQYATLCLGTISRPVPQPKSSCFGRGREPFGIYYANRWCAWL